jgi:hypothetical protein
MRAGAYPARDETMKQSDLAKCDDDLLYRVVELLFKERGKAGKRLKMETIASQVEEEFGKILHLTRESLYPLVEEAVARGIVRLSPPINRQWRDKLVQKYPGLATVKVNVVRTRGREDNTKVAEFAAEKAFAALMRIASAKNGEPVGLGLGPGRATLEFCSFLNDRLKFVPAGLKLRLVAITAGCPATRLAGERAVPALHRGRSGTRRSGRVAGGDGVRAGGSGGAGQRPVQRGDSDGAAVCPLPAPARPRLARPVEQPEAQSLQPPRARQRHRGGTAQVEGEVLSPES